MDPVFITIQVSAPTYWGYKYQVPRQYALNVDHQNLIQELKTHMKNFFKLHNLMSLSEGVDNLHLHIHQKIEPHHSVVYACCHHKTDKHNEQKHNIA